jgi:23S rRNA (cytidine1920-2'-O)/16S rRNA (cytidine1409-2'-O)-methyltransferase
VARGGRGRSRLDAELVRRGLSATREQAQEAIAAGRVLVSGAVAERAARLVDPSEAVELLGPGPRFVGRGGDKLAGALDRFGIDVTAATALDAGASTGGFTDCLLQYGAQRVIALDVGHGQLHPRLRADHRVVVLERCNLRDMGVDELARLARPATVPVAVVTADLSFISLTSVAPVLAGPVVEPGGELLVLVKPQFEVGRAAASKGRGVIRDPDLWSAALSAVASSLQTAGAAIMGAMPSPLLGSAGNTEFFLRARPHAGPPAAAGDVSALVAAAVAEASERLGLDAAPAEAGLPAGAEG